MAESVGAPLFVRHPPGFRHRRGLNWTFIGLLYTSFYMCRYNLPLASGTISSEFGFSKAQIGAIITTALLAYACGLILNGLLADRFGGKRAMLIAAAGTIIMNIFFGATSFWGLLWLFVVIRGIDGYMQAFGAPGMVKINAAWFRHTERGSFACMALIVRDTPEEANFPPVNQHEETAGRVQVKVFDVFKIIATNPVIWIVACAYACTGSVRQGIDQWFPRFLQEVHHLDYQSAQFQLVAFSIPFVASVGSLISGLISDKVFLGRRAPVAAGLYFLETAVILIAAQFHSANAAVVFLVLISFIANATHSILGIAAAMDIGGAKMAGFASGVIDSFQYFGGSLAGYFLGALLDRSWGNYFYFMAPFGLIGAVLMLSILGRVSLAKQPRAIRC